jgi:hypothetical protein
MAECLFCKEKVGANDFLPSEEAACSVCGNRPLSPEQDEPWWVSAAALEMKRPSITQHAPEPNEPQPIPPVVDQTAPPRPLASSNSRLPPRVETADDDEPPSFRDRLRNIDIGTASAFLCFSLALLFGSIYTLEPYIKPMAALGLLAGLLGCTVSALWRRRTVLLPSLMSFLCLLVLLFVGSWPGSSSAPPAQVMVPLRQQGMSAHQAASEDDWVDASANAIKRGDVRVEIVSARIGPVDLRQKVSATASAERFLAIRLRVSNEGILFQQTPYEPWADLAGSPSKHPPTMTDDRDRPYAQKTFDSGWKVVGRADVDALNTGHQVKEVLVYPVPARDVKHLRLKLPASAFGLSGAFRFQIPRSMIHGM